MARNNKSPYLVVMTKVGVQDKHNHARWIKMGQWYTWAWNILGEYTVAIINNMPAHHKGYQK